MAEKTFSWSADNAQITASGGDSSDPITFKDITDYFAANPIDLEYCMPRKYGSNPYELCEGNASDWNGLNGMGVPVDDTTEYHINSKSIYSQVSSLPSSIAITRIEVVTTGTVGLKITCDTSTLAQYDEIVITGTTNFNCATRILSKSSTYVMCFLPMACEGKAAETSGYVTKALAIGFNMNNQYRDTINNYPIFWSCIADTLKFSLKTNGTGNVKLLAVTVRNSINATPIPRNIGSGYSTLLLDSTINSDWQDFSLDIRKDFSHVSYIHQLTMYSQYTAKIYFFFSGLSVGEKVWIDGVRFVCSNPNPIEVSLNNYLFKTGLKINASYFKDYGFNLTIRMLDFYERYGTQGLYFAATSQGDIQFGDYSGYSSKRLGGTIYFDNIQRTTAQMYISKIDFQEINFQGKLHTLGTFRIIAYDSRFRSCIFNNIIEIVPTNTEFKNIIGSAGNQFLSSSGVNNTFENITLYDAHLSGSSYLFLLRPINIQSILRNIKIINNLTSRWLIYIDRYTSGSYGYKFINFDISEVGDGAILRQSNVGSYTYPQVLFAFSIDMLFKDKEQPLLGVQLLVKDRDGNIVLSEISDINGKISDKSIDYFENDVTLPSTSNFIFGETTNFIKKYPFTVEISKSGYQTISFQLMQTYDKTDPIICKGINWRVEMLKEILKISSIKFIHPSLANNDGEIIISAKGGVEPYEYSIDDGETWQSSGEFTGLAAGDYIVKVKDNEGIEVDGVTVTLKKTDYIDLENLEFNLETNSLEFEIEPEPSLTFELY